MTQTTKTLQYQLSNGSWVDCEDRTEYFMSLCEQYNGVDENGNVVALCNAEGPAIRQQIIEALESGETVRNDSADWYSRCRYEPAPVVEKEPEMVRCSCGHSVPLMQVMSASMGSSCPDCYDRMSE